jgi:hypothetical protein
VRAKGDIARSPGHRRPDFGFEPLPIFTHQTNRGDFGPANLGSQQGDIVKGLFWTGIEDLISTQRLEALRFVGWQRSDHWTKSGGAPTARCRFTIFNINIIFFEDNHVTCPAKMIFDTHLRIAPQSVETHQPKVPARFSRPRSGFLVILAVVLVRFFWGVD